MRILVTIPHYHGPTRAAFQRAAYGSTGSDASVRIDALRASITALHHHFSFQAVMYSDVGRVVLRAPDGGRSHTLDIVVVTTGGRHLLDGLGLPGGLFNHREVVTDPLTLGFACHEVLAENLGRYDYYCFMEDDLVITDQGFFDKLTWFNEKFGAESVLFPNRYETLLSAPCKKLYIDRATLENLPEQSASPDDRRAIHEAFLARPLVLKRPSNPHSGCFFLNEAQFRTWREQPYFLDRNAGFVGPLESAATLGVMRTFKIYKPWDDWPGFLEIHHACNRYLGRTIMGTPGT